MENTLDDLEKHLREKALRSMRKAQMSPSQMSWKQAALTREFSNHSWCLSSTWFSFRMYKLLNLDFCFFLLVWYILKGLICWLVYYLNCKEACDVHNFNLSAGKQVRLRGFDLGRLNIISTAYSRFCWEMIACAVIVSDVHEPLTLWSIGNYTVTYSYFCLLVVRDGCVHY